MNQFCVARHGQTANNKSKTFSGWVDTPLTPQGVQDAQSTAAKLADIRFDVITSSDLGRAFITAYLISRQQGYTDEVLRSDKLREVSYGDVGQMSIEKAQAIYPGLDTETNFIAPNGESLGQMQQRALKFINRLDEQYNGKNILLVTHGGVIDAIKANFLDDDLGHFMTTQGITNSHDYVATFGINQGRVVNHREITL